MRTIPVFTLMILLTSTAFSQWTRTNGPEGISISSLTTIDATIYAGTEVNGLYASTDDGLSWMPMNAGFENLEVRAVVTRPGYLFAGTFGGGVFRSTDDGATWLAPVNAGDLAVTAMVVQGPYVFLGTIDQGVYRSSDNGATWEQKIGGFTSIEAMCISGNTIFASTYGYTYASSDSGETWFDVTALQGGGIFSFYCRDSLIIAGAVNKIFKSTDFGTTFNTIPINFTFSIVNIYAITEIGSTLFIATSYDGVNKSVDGGLTWSAANTGMGPKDVLALTVSPSAALLAGTHYVGMFRSTDMGSNWTKYMDGFPAGATIATMLATGSSVFAGTRGDGIYRTTDNGGSWIKLGGNIDSLKYATVRGLCEKDGAVYAGIVLQFNGIVYKSIDNGETWIRSGNGLPANLTFVNEMTTSGNNILASTGAGVYYSPDDGVNWYQSNLPAQHIYSIAASGNFAYAPVGGVGIYRSADSGISWSVALQSPGVDYVEVAAIDNYAFAGSFFEGARFSANNGGTWFMSGGFPNDASIFEIEPVGNGMILAGTDLEPNWIYVSLDNGGYYSLYSGGLAERAPVEAFAVNDSFMFAGTDDNGVWRRLLPGLVNIQAGSGVSETFNLAQNYPNPFNPVTTIEFNLPAAGEATLKIYNLLGEEVATLLSAYLHSGYHSLAWDASDMATGVYIYQLKAGEYLETRKMILVK